MVCLLCPLFLGCPLLICFKLIPTPLPLISSDNKRENTEEYFYKDITNFSTSAETIEAFRVKNGCFGAKATEEKVNREFSDFGLIVPGDKFRCSTSNSKNIDQSVSAMKQKLREKKNA